MNKRQVREVLTPFVFEAARCKPEVIHEQLGGATDAIMNLSEPMLSGLLYRAMKAAHEMRRSAKSIRAESPDLEDVAVGNEEIANTIDDLLSQARPTVSRDEIHMAYHESEIYDSKGGVENIIKYLIAQGVEVADG